MFGTLFTIVLFFIGLSLVLLGVGILIKKGGKFPETHIGKNKEMKKRGIHCVQSGDAIEREKYSPIKIKEQKDS
ncbi:MAG: hypothetical protein LBM07_01210 [Culturomica sp.]|jgi:hypothetical protein|nr:hypothetical protein [Culturomica sp.]